MSASCFSATFSPFSLRSHHSPYRRSGRFYCSITFDGTALESIDNGSSPNHYWQHRTIGRCEIGCGTVVVTALDTEEGAG